jgi:hypothetical protein
MATMLAEPDVRKNPLRTRLAAVRFRLRSVTLIRGLSCAIALLLAIAVVACSLDCWIHLPAVVRAFFLVAALAGSGVVVHALVLRPLLLRNDDFSLALRIEHRYPILNDALASTVQFLDQSGRSSGESSSMRLEATRRTFALIKHCDFNTIVDSRGIRSSVGLASVFLLIAAGLAAWKPAQAATSLARLAYPFGTVEWPKQTSIEITSARKRIGRNHPWEVAGTLRGVIPEKAYVQVKTEGKAIEDYSCEVSRDDDGQAVFKLSLVKDRTFSYVVKANDAVTPSSTVEVVAPPVLVPLDDRPTPQVRLRYPEYTGLPDPQTGRPSPDLPDSVGDITAPWGTQVTFRAAADRPLKKAQIELYPDLDQTDAVTFAAEFGRRITADFDAARQVFTIDFQPRARGQYALYIEDENELWDRRYFELSLQADPPPVVELEQPTVSRQSLRMLPAAEFSLAGIARDPTYSARNVWLEYRLRKNDAPRKVDLDNVDRLAGEDRRQARSQRKEVKFRRTMKIADFARAEGAPLKVGDTLLLVVAADDFDDVTPNKLPGRSHEIEIQIIDRNALDVILSQEQGKIQKEMVRLLEQERDALRKQEKVAANLEKNGKLDQEHLDLLAQIEQLSQQIRERVGKTKDEGLRAQVERIRETLKDNKLPRSGIHERLDELARELDRLSSEELEQVEPRLSNARKQQEAASKDPASLPKTRQELGQAEQHEKEVEKTLDRMLSRFEEVSSTLEHKGELKSILRDQRELTQRTDEEKRKTLGKNLEDLSRDDRQELERLQLEQKRLDERLDQILEKLERLAKEKEHNDPATAKEIRDSVEHAKTGDIQEPFKRAQEHIRNNQLEKALQAQREGAEKLEKLIRSMEDKREAELDRLLKKLKEEQKKLEKLTEEQEKLRKKIEEAGRIADPKQREAAMKGLAGEQRKLKDEAAAIQQELSKLSRLRAQKADEDVQRAAQEMEKSLKRLERGQMPEENPDEMLDRLDDAQRELSKAQKDAEEELAREQLIRVAESIRQLKERQEALIAEAERLRNEAERTRSWRVLKISLQDLTRNQRDLASELTRLADDKLARAVVVARVLHGAADDMNRAAQRFDDQLKAIADNPGDLHNLTDGIRAQSEARHKLELVVEAIKPEAAMPLQNAAARQGGGQGSGQGAGAASDADAIPDLAQLKLLKAMQVDVNQRSDAFTKLHPDLTKLTPEQGEELRKIRAQQQEVADLFEQMLDKTNPEGDKP